MTQTGTPDATSDSTLAKPQSSIKETVISLIIAFVVAFVFRGFVLEPFMIPTGSMAPTLMGAHLRFDDKHTGYDWAVNPWENAGGNSQAPLPRQGSGGKPIIYHDPMSGREGRDIDLPTRSGDRIFVLKSVYSFFDPSRFDVVVFKYPGPTAGEAPGSQNNYIKRLVGLPGEQIAFIDGDVFTRRPTDAQRGEEDPWAGEGWKIARKPERVQRAVWQPIFDSQYTPWDAQRGEGQFSPPWKGTTDGWNFGDGGKTNAHYRCEAVAPTALEWTNRPITDWTAYNEFYQVAQYPPTPGRVQPVGGSGGLTCFAVSDVRARCTLTPDADGLAMSACLMARGHEFRADLSGGHASLRMRPAPTKDDADPAWKELASVALPERALKPGRATAVEFWHVDQTLGLWIDGERIVEAGYDWSPAQRILASTGMSLDDALAEENKTRGKWPLYEPAKYRQAAFRFEFSGSKFTIHRSAMDRDLYYQPREKPDGTYGLGTHPTSSAILTGDQFVFCGDNSPASADSRLWTDVDPFTANQIDDTVGVVHRDLLVGRAFCVYFPAPKPGSVPIPDAGRLRFIW
ncbi:MAG: hypothetical protein IT432_10490 [Phycisphaerales bacterium]|nr:hypothetical protein [Phycisphaerales bacterium]